MSANEVYRLAYEGTAGQIADEYGIPRPLFFSLIEQESGWNINAKGSAGEIGLTQLKPGTAKEVGANPFDPIDNLRGGAAYLTKQFKAFGSWENALIAYNRGPGTFQAVAGGQANAQQKQSYAQGTTYANEVLTRAQQDGFVQASTADQTFPGLNDLLNDLKIFGYSPADIFRNVIGLPSQIVGDTVGNIPGVGGVVQGATDVLTGQRTIGAILTDAADWIKENVLYVLVFAALVAMVFFSAGAFLKG